MVNPISIQTIRKALVTHKTDAVRFRLPFSPEQVATLLTEAYCHQVSRRNCTFDAEPQTVEKISKVSQWLTSSSLKPCLLLYGGVGNGKSTMARAVSQLFMGIRTAYSQSNKDYWRYTMEQRSFVDAMIVWLDTPEFVSAIELSELATNDRARYELIKHCRLLIIDDMGIEPSVIKSYGTELTPLTDILYYRYDHSAMTIITSNLDDSRITQRYGIRVWDRLSETFERLNYTNKSFR